ncbi:MAG: MFS transporter [Dehalococcoidia bacterium]|nr:MFS transporter [Dehalococcoidia bacterium]
MPRSSYLSRTFYALENEAFRIFWMGTLVSFLGMQMQVIARGYLAYDLTGKNSALGGVMLAFGVPQLLLGMWGGVVADRFPKKKVLVVSQAAIALNSAWLAFMIEFDMVEYWMLVAAGVVQGAGFAFVGPARQAFITDLVGRESIGNAVVLQQLSMNSTRVIGPSFAGILIAVPLLGIAGVYFLTTAGFIVAVFSLWRLPAGNPRPGASDRSPLADLTDGLRYVRRSPAILQLILVSFAVIMIGFPYQSFLPSVAKSVYGVGGFGLGLLSSAAAVGAVAATIVVAGTAGHRRAWSFQPIVAMGFGASVIGFAAAPNFFTGMFALVFVGALASGFQSLNNSLTMTLTERDYHGRVQSISMMSWSLFGLASLPIGVLADHIGIRETLALMGGICIAIVLLITVWGRVRNAAPQAAAEARATLPLSERPSSGS